MKDDRNGVGRAPSETGSHASTEPHGVSALSGFDPSRGCSYCADPEGGERWFPMYGVAPHECYWRKGPEFTIGQSTLLPFESWTECFVPELEDGETWADFKYPQACGVFYCPRCDREEYERDWAAFVARVGLPPSDSDGSPEGEDPKGLSAQHDSAAIAQTPPLIAEK